MVAVEFDDGFVGSASYYEEAEKPFRGGRKRQGYEERRARMRREGARMLAKHGVGRVALCDVAVASGIARGSAYYYYDGWEELLRAIVDEHITLVHERVGDADDLNEHEEPVARLTAVARAFLAVIREQENQHRVQLEALHALPDGVAEWLRFKHRWLGARIGEAIAAAVPGLKQRRDLRSAAAMSFMSLASYSALWFNDEGPLTLDDYARMMALMVISGARRMLRETPSKAESGSQS
jgi:AcrR family transcriptional regulator